MATRLRVIKISYIFMGLYSSCSFLMKNIRQCKIIPMFIITIVPVFEDSSICDPISFAKMYIRIDTPPQFDFFTNPECKDFMKSNLRNICHSNPLLNSNNDSTAINTFQIYMDGLPINLQRSPTIHEYNTVPNTS